MPAIATLVFLVIWGVLVWVAVGFGADARGGDSGAWVKLAIAAVAAVACLFMTFTFAGRAWHALNGSSAPPSTDDYTGSHSNAYVEEQDYPGQPYGDQTYSEQAYPEQAYPEQDYYGTGAYTYDDTGSYGRHSTDTGSQPPYGDTGSRAAFGDTGSRAAFGDTGSRSAYGDTGSRSAYGDTGSRSAYGDTGSRSAYGDTGSRSAYGDTGSRSAYGDTGSRSAYGDTGSRSAYGDTGSRSAYQPPAQSPQSSQPYYTSPPTPASTPTTPASPQTYVSPDYGTESHPAQQAGSQHYQSGAYQSPTSYGQTGSRARLTQDPAATQAMPTQRQPQDPPPAQPDDEWPPRHSSRNKQWPPAEPDTPYRGRH